MGRWRSSRASSDSRREFRSSTSQTMDRWTWDLAVTSSATETSTPDHFFRARRRHDDDRPARRIPLRRKRMRRDLSASGRAVDRLDDHSRTRNSAPVGARTRLAIDVATIKNTRPRASVIIDLADEVCVHSALNCRNPYAFLIFPTREPQSAVAYAEAAYRLFRLANRLRKTQLETPIRAWWPVVGSRLCSGRST